MNCTHRKKKRFTRNAFLFLLVLLSVHAHSQRAPGDSTRGPVRWLQVEKSMGLYPEMDFMNGAGGISLCRGKFLRGTPRAMAGTLYYCGLGYDTDHRMLYASFGTGGGYFKRKFGLQGNVKGCFYMTKNSQVFCIRPEAGIGFPKAHLLYGYNFRTSPSELVLPSHSLTLYVYFGLNSSRTMMF